MPSSKKKRRNKYGAKAQAGRSTSEGARNGLQGDPAATSLRTFSSTHSRPCLALKADGMTQCGQLATEGHPEPNRCRVHYGQFCILYEKYRNAEKVVDDLRKDADLPTKEQISHCTDWHAALEKAQKARKYLEVVRVEKRGREIHEKRFFLKVDDGHRRRLKLLEGEMTSAINTLDALHQRAYELYKDALPGVEGVALSKVEEEWVKESRRSNKQLVECTLYPFTFTSGCFAIPHLIKPISELGDEDLINCHCESNEKEKMIGLLKALLSLDPWIGTGVERGSLELPKTSFKDMLLENSYQQLARRIIFYEPSLFMKSLGRVSVEDFVLNTDLSVEDLIRFLDVLLQPMGFPLKWVKDAIWDASLILHDSAAAYSSAESRIPLLGGYIFNHAHTATIPNEVWGYLLTMFQPPADAESCFIRLCNNFEDVVGLFSFAALGLVPSPSFCQSRPHFDADDPALSRNHLSLSGVIVADMSSIPVPPELRGPLPTIYRARQRGCVVWAEMEPRAYMFGALPNERAGFVNAFIRELRARPDLFQVVLRSDTAPSRQVEMFGSGALNDQALPLLRSRQFEAPPWPSPPSAPLSANDRWKVEYSALDLLYGSRGDFNGYLTKAMQKGFFQFKRFPVTYFVILDTVPYRDRSVLARNVAWAALRAGGYAQGEYTVHKYAAAADRLVKKCAEERLGWVPEEMKWKIPMMQDQMSWCSVM